ncbi:MAG: hypothetical protein AAF267_10020 [Deinococcota bacterium]
MRQQLVYALMQLLLTTSVVTATSWVSAQMDPLIGATNGQEVILVVEGLSVPEDGRATTGSDLAVEDALRNAVQQVARSYLNNDALFDNYQPLRDSVATDSSGAARLIRILGQGFGGDGIYRVTAEVGVRQAWLERDLRNLILNNNDTRIVVIPASQSDATSSGSLLSNIRGYLVDRGYSVVMDATYMPRGVQALADVADTALHFGADLALIVDLWFHEDMTPPEALERAGLHSVTVSVAFDLVSMADGHVVYSNSDARPGAGIHVEAAIQQALDDLMPPLQAALEAHLADWAQTQLDNLYMLEIADLQDFGQLNNVVNYLDSHAQAVTMRAYNDGIGVIELDYTGAPDELVRLLTQEGLAITQLRGNTIRVQAAQ